MTGGGSSRPDHDASRRAFLKRMAALAFAAPVVSSFTIDAVAHAGDDGRLRSHQIFPNQIFPNQFFLEGLGESPPTNFFPNQAFPNQIFPNQLP